MRLSPPHLSSSLYFWCLAAVLCLGVTSLQAAVIMTNYGNLTQVGSGTKATGATGTFVTESFSTAEQALMQVNRSATGFGLHTSAVEGVYFTYSFTASVAGSNPLLARFDAQIQMNSQLGYIWSGWGQDIGKWQNGPTTSSWSRGTRYQHVYPGGTPTSTVNLVNNEPTPDASVLLNSTLAAPRVGDVLSATVMLNAVNNTISSIYTNVTTGETFVYTFLNPNISGGNLLSFNNIQFRSDSNISSFNYSFGTLVAPEPGRAVLLLVGGICLLGVRQRRRR